MNELFLKLSLLNLFLLLIVYSNTSFHLLSLRLNNPWDMIEFEVPTGHSLVTQPMLQLRPNQTELRSMDISNQIFCRFQKYKRKIPPPSPVFFFDQRGGTVEKLFAYIFRIYKKFGLKDPSMFDSVSVAT